MYIRNILAHHQFSIHGTPPRLSSFHPFIHTPMLGYLVLWGFGFVGLLMLKRFRRSLSGKDSDDDHEERLAKLEKRNLPYSVRARVENSGQVKSLRRHVFREAELKHAFYMAEEEGIQREGMDLVVNVVFASRGEAYTFESALTEACILCRIPRTSRKVKVKSFSGTLRVDEDGDPARVFRDDYDESKTDSPDGSASQVESSQVASNFSASREIVRYQSIESPEYVSWGGAEKCHLVPQSELETQEEKDDEDNMLSMSPSYHKLLDGKKNLVPPVRISVVDEQASAEMPDAPPGRHLVSLQVEFREAWVADVWAKFLKDGTRQISDKAFITWVFVEYPDDFKNNIRIKYDETSGRWENGR